MMRRSKQPRNDQPSDALGISGLVDVLPLASGGTGAVYRARQSAFDRIVAVKVLAAPIADEAARTRFQREQQITGRLTGHPHVARVYEAGFTSSNQPYLVMEYYSGGTFRDLVASQGRQPEGRVCLWGVELAGALATAHSIGILHRDVKPANVLIDQFGEPMLADFGIAGRSDNAENLTHAFTTEFAAPEVLSRTPVFSEAGDQYSLALTLVNMLLGYVPEAGADLRALLGAAVSPPVADTMIRALATDPGARFASVVDFGVSLQEAQRLAGFPLTDMKLGAVEPADSAVTSVTGATTAGAMLTMTPQTRLSRPAEENGSRSVRRIVITAAGAVVGLALLGGVAAAVLGGGSSGSEPLVAPPVSGEGLLATPTSGTQSAPTTPTAATSALLNAPTNVRITNDSGTSINVAWDDTNGGQSIYLVAWLSSVDKSQRPKAFKSAQGGISLPIQGMQPGEAGSVLVIASDPNAPDIGGPSGSAQRG